MGTLSSGLVQLVASLTGVTPLIGALPTMRFYPVRLPTVQTPVYPAVTYQRIDDDSVYAHSGYSGLITARMQFTVWAKTDNTASLVELAIRNGIHALYPVVNNAKVVFDGIQFDRIFTVGGIADYEETTQTHQRTLDLMIGYVG